MQQNIIWIHDFEKEWIIPTPSRKCATSFLS